LFKAANMAWRFWGCGSLVSFVSSIWPFGLSRLARRLVYLVYFVFVDLVCLVCLVHRVYFVSRDYFA